jgi:acyl-CoA reductase-like NAD-dependent aldehyde dehydrogenase
MIISPPATFDHDITARNPATGEELGRITPTLAEEVVERVARAREAQSAWGASDWKHRRATLHRWWQILAKDADSWAQLVSSEIGKPYVEALAGDVVSSLDCIRWTVKNAGKALAPERLGPSWQRALFLPTATLRWAPYGVIGMIGTWNYPLFLNAPAIAQALAAGNAVVWKPSELAPLCGLKLEQSLEAAGFPPGLIATLHGGPDVGRALVGSMIDKVMFTGGVETGRRIIGELSQRGIPALAELSGFDAAIVLPDAPLDSTAKALAWASFVGCGQTCIAVKRIYAVGDAEPLANAIASIARGLSVGDPANPDVDLGPMISHAARDRFHQMVLASVSEEGQILAGGEPILSDGSYYPPTVILADSQEAEDALSGCFGPIVVIRSADDAEHAVSLANHSNYGLAASVWSSSLPAARNIARRLHAGMISINDAVTPASHAAAPFGGFKASGFGRTKGKLGLREFVQPQVFFDRKPGGLRPQLFPYSSGAFTVRFLKFYLRVFHGSR